MKQLSQRMEFIGLCFVILISSIYLVNYYEQWRNQFVLLIKRTVLLGTVPLPMEKGHDQLLMLIDRPTAMIVSGKKRSNCSIDWMCQTT